MHIRCERCESEHEVDDSLVGARGTTFRCPGCGHHFRIRRPPPPASAPSSREAGDATAAASPQHSLVLGKDAPAPVHSFRVNVTAGPDAGKAALSVEGRLAVGVFPGDGPTLQLTDPTVSRFHLELEAGRTGVVVRDLESTNGTFLGTTRVGDIIAREAIELAIGDSRVRIEPLAAQAAGEEIPAAAFGALIGSSQAMRAAYRVLEQVAPTSAPVLITGETGTGKELAARGVHDASPRAKAPFEVVDCGGVPSTLLESELFGHEKGAFTSAVSARRGAFERANGGTLFLDEIGELPLEMQPKLLRALAEGEFRRVGGEKTHRTDVRIVAATNRDLRREVNAGRFRPDLYFRLAVIHVQMPALRDRLDDLAELVPALLASLRRDRARPIEVRLDADLLAALARHTWPGNVRELRNHLEQLTILHAPPPLVEPGDAPAAPGVEDLCVLPMREAKQVAVERFERDYLAALLGKTGGNVARRLGAQASTAARSFERYGGTDFARETTDDTRAPQNRVTSPSLTSDDVPSSHLIVNGAAGLFGLIFSIAPM